MSFSSLTKENLEKLVSQFETQLNQLEKDPKSVNPVDYTWHSFRNRFFDIRRDDNLLYASINKNHRDTCKARCMHGKIDYYDRINVSPCDENCERDEENGHYCSVHDRCTCQVDCECFELLSTGTFGTEYFVKTNGVKPLIYEGYNDLQLSDFWYRVVEPTDLIKDPYMLRGRQMQYNQKIWNLTLSLNSFPILEKNILRLNTEIVRQESHRWCMANIRSLRFLNSMWYVPNDVGLLIGVHVPNDLITVIFYYASF